MSLMRSMTYFGNPCLVQRAKASNGHLNEACAAHNGEEMSWKVAWTSTLFGVPAACLLSECFLPSCIARV